MALGQQIQQIHEAGSRDMAYRKTQRLVILLIRTVVIEGKSPLLSSTMQENSNSNNSYLSSLFMSSRGGPL